MDTRYDYPPAGVSSPLSRPTSDVTVTTVTTDRSTDDDLEFAESSSSDDLEEGDVLITVTDEEGRVRGVERQQERNVLRKKTAARYPQSNRYSSLIRQRRWWKNREKHLLMFIAIATIIVNILAAVAVIVWGVIYQRTP